MTELDPLAAFSAFWRSLSPERAFRILFCLFLSLHVWKVARLVPLELLADGAPLVEYHYSQIYVDVVHDRAFRQVSGRSWGYDPYTGGGQIVGAGFVPESHAVIVFDRLLRPFLQPDTTIKIFAGLALLAAPLVLFASARLFGLAPPAALASAALFSAGMISHDVVSRTLIYRGHITFWFACVVALLNAGAFYAWTFQRGRRLAAVWILTWPLLLLLDPAVALVQMLPTLSIALFQREQRVRTLLSLGGVILLSAIANAFWLVPYLKFHSGLLDMSEWPSGGLPILADLFLPVHGAFIERFQSAMRGSLLLMALVGLFAGARERRKYSAMMILWLMALVAITLFGSSLPFFHAMEPGRLSFAVTTLLLLPAGGYIRDHFLAPGSRRLIFAGWFLWFLMTWQLVHPYEGYPLRNALTARETRLLADLRSLPPDGRILIQYHPLFTDGLRLASVERVHAFIGFTGSWWKNREESNASFGLYLGKWYLFGTPLTAYSEKQLLAALASYNVAYVVTTAPVGNAFFSYYDGFEEVPAQGEGAYRIFRVKAHKPGYLLGSSGNVTFDYDRMWIRGAPAGPLTVSFHDVDGFVTTPPLPVHRVDGAPGAPPLLGIDNPLGRSSIEVRYDGR